MSSAAIYDLEIVYRKIDSLIDKANNARTHSKHQIREIAKSIRKYGFVNPVLIDNHDAIVAGYGRKAAAKLLGISEIPTVRLCRLSPMQIRAYMIADNKLAEKSDWDLEILAVEFKELLALEDSGIDITDTAFEMGEIDLIIERAKVKPVEEEIFSTPTADQIPVSRSGDLWLLDKHKVICGNSLDETVYQKLFEDARATVVFTDPPYNVRIHGHATGNGLIRHREFAMASGEKSESEFFSFLNESLTLAAKYSADRSVHYVCMDWRSAGTLLSVGKQVYGDLLNVCVWVKNQGAMGSMYRSQHELVFVFRKGKASHRNNVQLGKFGRNRTNVWQYAGIQTLSRQSDEGNLLAMHPTVKPIAMVADAILDCSARGEIVLDSFLGSGTALMASERVGRVCYGIEIDPLYVDTAIRRWQKQTGETAIHSATGRTFNEIQQEVSNV